MGLKSFRPFTPSLRGTVLPDFSEITKRKPERKLTVAKRKTGGRNCHGRLTSRGIGGGHKQRYRIIDFKRDKVGIPATVEAIEYDPNRSARIALLKYQDGEKRYIIAPMGLEVGAKVVSGPDAELAIGNSVPLRKIMSGLPIHNIELHKGHGGQLCRSAAMAAQVMACGRRLRDREIAFGRNPQNPCGLLRHDRPGRKPGPHEHHAGQGGAQPVAGDSSASRAAWRATRSIIRWAAARARARAAAAGIIPFPLGANWPRAA